ncbi:hypothetical protein RC62_809 [Flavobacterium aquidurense]|uniref:Uncharacterized protein n=1 Tax=Flavobacterium aquidurense TaxID=362413 RepID=A0A0Q0W6V0_9FLAO|nr:hypothetical protein RC62_809 [Flavobacterium aquidurense]
MNGGTKGQVLTSNGADDATWSNAGTNAIKIARIDGAGRLDFVNDLTIINAASSNGTIQFILPTTEDTGLIGKIFSIKRADANNGAIVKIVAESGTIEETDTQMTLGETNTVQITIESVAPMKWQIISKF